MRERDLSELSVKQSGVETPELTELRERIIQYYGSVYKFAPAVGFTQSMLSRMLHGRRKIYPDSRKRMGELLEIPESEHTKYFGR